MSTNEHDIDLIEKFLGKELNQEEKQEFRDRYQNDAEFYAKVNSFADITVALNAAKEKPQQKSQYKTWYLVAATLLLIIGIGFSINYFLKISWEDKITNEDPKEVEPIDSLHQQDNQVQNIDLREELAMHKDSIDVDYIDQKKLLAFYFEPYVSPSQKRSGRDSMVLAFYYYDRAFYDSANWVFQDLIKTAVNDTLLFFKGISCIKLAKYDESNRLFHQIMTNKDNRYYPQAKWYLALTYLGEKDGRNKSKVLLREIIAKNSYNADQARELLIKLE